MLTSKFACGSSRLFCFVHMEDFLCSSEFFVLCSYGRLPLCSSGQCCSLLFIRKTSSLFRWNILFFVHKKHLLFMQTESSALFTLKIWSLFWWEIMLCSPGQFAQEESSALFTWKIWSLSKRNALLCSHRRSALCSSGKFGSLFT